MRQVGDPRPRRSYSRAMAAALSLFREGGLQAVTVEAVAARSGMARTTLYRLWPSRAVLLDDVVAQYRIDLTTPPREAPVAERLRLLLTEMVGYLSDEHWQGALPELLAAVVHGRVSQELATRIHAGHEQVLSAVLSDGIADGELPPDTDIAEASIQIMGPILAAALLQPAALGPALAERVVELFVLSRRN